MPHHNLLTYDQPGTSEYHASLPGLPGPSQYSPLDYPDGPLTPLRRTDSVSDLYEIQEAQARKKLILENEKLQQALRLSRHEEQVARARFCVFLGKMLKEETLLKKRENKSIFS
jgi:hypothetical protein